MPLKNFVTFTDNRTISIVFFDKVTRNTVAMYDLCGFKEYEDFADRFDNFYEILNVRFFDDYVRVCLIAKEY